VELVHVDAEDLEGHAADGAPCAAHGGHLVAAGLDLLELDRQVVNPRVKLPTSQPRNCSSSIMGGIGGGFRKMGELTIAAADRLHADKRSAAARDVSTPEHAFAGPL
jgi:hypothetical protein